MDVGQELRQARESRDMSLQQLSRITKITPRVLQIIEASDETRLPARVFTRAFVRSYAVEVGLDPDDIVRRYFEQVEVAEPAVPFALEPAPDPLPGTVTADALRRFAEYVLHGRLGTATVLTFVVIMIVVLATSRREAPQAVAAAPQERPVATAGFAPAAPAQPAAIATTGTEQPLHIAIAPTGPCWVQAIVGDTRVFGTMLNAGDRRTIDAPSDVTLRVGDPATFTFTINGRPARIAGASAQAVTVRITRDNYTQFLSR